MKKILASILAVCIGLCVFAGCAAGADGVDGRAGRDLDIYDIYAAANEELEKEGKAKLSLLEFLKEYMNYDGGDLEKASSLKTAINRSLLSSVSVYAVLEYSDGSSYYQVGGGVIVEVDKAQGSAYVLTNCHIVYDDSSLYTYSRDVFVLLYGMESPQNEDYRVPAELVGASVSYDMALLKITDSELIRNSDVRAAEFSSSDEVFAGEAVYTIGNPELEGFSVTSGIITKESETIAINLSSLYNNQKYYRVMRTDASVNSGNSGGALFNLSGEIMGIVNSRNSDDNTQGIGYALCGSYVKRLYKLMLDGYGSTNGLYGVRKAVFPTNYEYTSSAYFDVDAGVTRIKDKIVVTYTVGDLHKGDVIKNIKIKDGGKVVEDVATDRYYLLDDVLLSARMTSTVVYTVSRGGEDIEVETLPNFRYCT